MNTISFSYKGYNAARYTINNSPLPSTERSQNFFRIFKKFSLIFSNVLKNSFKIINKILSKIFLYFRKFFSKLKIFLLPPLFPSPRSKL